PPALAQARPRTIGLDGVVAQQENYRTSGFQLAYANIRYGGTVAAGPAPPAGIGPLADVPFAALEADDATVFPAPRAPFLRAWIGARGHIPRARARRQFCCLGCDPPMPERPQDRPAGGRRPRCRRGHLRGAA